MRLNMYLCYYVTSIVGRTGRQPLKASQTYNSGLHRHTAKVGGCAARVHRGRKKVVHPVSSGAEVCF
jgi:hypothetical protein